MHTNGGDSAVFQQLFWLYSHAAVYSISMGLLVTAGGLWLWMRGRGRLGRRVMDS